MQVMSCLLPPPTPSQTVLAHRASQGRCDPLTQGSHPGKCGFCPAFPTGPQAPGGRGVPLALLTAKSQHLGCSWQLRAGHQVAAEPSRREPVLAPGPSVPETPQSRQPPAGCLSPEVSLRAGGGPVRVLGRHPAVRARAVSPGQGHSAERLRKGLGGAPGRSTQGEHSFWEVGRGQGPPCGRHRRGRSTPGPGRPRPASA